MFCRMCHVKTAGVDGFCSEECLDKYDEAAQYMNEYSGELAEVVPVGELWMANDEQLERLSQASAADIKRCQETPW